MAENKNVLIMAGFAGAALVLFGVTRLWPSTPKGEKIKASYDFDYLGPARTLRVGVRLGSWNGFIFDEVGTLITSAPIALPEAPQLTNVQGDIVLTVPPTTDPDTYDAEFSIRRADDSDIYPDGIGKTRDIQENVVTVLEGGEVVVH